MQRLIAILGQRAFWSFAVVTLLVAALLAAVNITSRHALKSYVEDQLERISWDLAMIQTTGFTLTSELSQRMSSVEGLEQVESLVLLRARLPRRRRSGFRGRWKAFDHSLAFHAGRH